MARVRDQNRLIRKLRRHFREGEDHLVTGKFKTPTLRNIALTAPCMHDGSIPTLAGVLDHDNPNKDPLVAGFQLSPQDRADLIEFLKSLTDEDVRRDPRFSDPR